MLKRSRETLAEGRRGFIEALSLQEAREVAELYNNFAPNLNASYPHELALMAKHFSVPQRKIRIIDHPCGELVVFVTYLDGKEVFEGYLQDIV